MNPLVLFELQAGNIHTLLAVAIMASPLEDLAVAGRGPRADVRSCLGLAGRGRETRGQVSAAMIVASNRAFEGA